MSLVVEATTTIPNTNDKSGKKVHKIRINELIWFISEAKVEQWRAKQAKLAAAREEQEQAAAVEEAVVVEETPVTEVVEVAQEVEETPPVAEEVKEERPERDFESFVEDVVGKFDLEISNLNRMLIPIVRTSIYDQ